MKKQRRTGIIAFIALLSVVSFSFIYSNISFFGNVFYDFLNQLFLMFLYAAIPCVPAVILRLKFGLRALKWIAFAATVLGLLCCLTYIILPKTTIDEFGALEYILLTETESEEVLEEFKTFYPNTILDDVETDNANYSWALIFFTQYALTSSVPALYCIAFIGKGRAIFAALVPSLMFFLTLCIRYAMISDFSEILKFIFDYTILTSMLASIIFAVWALLLIFISHMVYTVINRVKTKMISHKI